MSLDDARQPVAVADYRRRTVRSPPLRDLKVRFRYVKAGFVVLVLALLSGGCDKRPRHQRRKPTLVRQRGVTSSQRNARIRPRRKIATKRRYVKHQKSPSPKSVSRALTSKQRLSPKATTGTRKKGVTQWSTPGLIRQLEQGTVMVLVHRIGGQMSMGSGFFVTRRYILTNKHVVEGARRGGIQVMSKALGKARAATLIQVNNGDMAHVDGDYALLKLAKPARVRPFALTDSLNKLDMVIAAGFPGIVVEMDKLYQRMLMGDPTAVPDIVLTRGEVSAIQNQQSRGAPLIVHTALISQGNSGGPLVDVCGRVVGINTFIRLKQGSKVNYSLSATHLAEFIGSIKSLVRVSRRKCVPGSL